METPPAGNGAEALAGVPAAIERSHVRLFQLVGIMFTEGLIMLSKDELQYGIPFVLKLWSDTGVAQAYIKVLSGDRARFWFDIYQRSDWEALRLNASSDFTEAAKPGQADAQIRDMRCVVISTHVPTVEQLAPALQQS